MKVLYEEIDGQIYPNKIFLPADIGKVVTWYTLQAPFERIYPEDLHDDLKVITLTIGEIIRDPFEDKGFGVKAEDVLKLCQELEIPKDQMNDIDYYMLLVDSLEEVMQLDVREKLL